MSTSLPPAEHPSDASCGSVLLLPEPKRLQYTTDLVVVNPYQQPPPPLCPASATSLQGDHCCNCMHQSTCKTRKCSCIQAGTPCQSCVCHDKCCNHTTGTKIKITLSVPPPDKVDPGTAVAPNSSDPPSVGLSTAALPLAPLDPAAPSASPPPEALAAPLPTGDLPGTPLMDADRLLDTVYGDHVHTNPAVTCQLASPTTWSGRPI